MLECTIVGTYSGIVEKLGYLKRLGVNAIELLPVHEFNELEYYKVQIARTHHAPVVCSQPLLADLLHHISHGAKYLPALRTLCFWNSR